MLRRNETELSTSEFHVRENITQLRFRADGEGRGGSIGGCLCVLLAWLRTGVQKYHTDPEHRELYGIVMVYPRHGLDKHANVSLRTYLISSTYAAAKALDRRARRFGARSRVKIVAFVQAWFS